MRTTAHPPKRTLLSRFRGVRRVRSWGGGPTLDPGGARTYRSVRSLPGSTTGPGLADLVEGTRGGRDRRRPKSLPYTFFSVPPSTGEVSCHRPRQEGDTLLVTGPSVKGRTGTSVSGLDSRGRTGGPTTTDRGSLVPRGFWVYVFTPGRVVRPQETLSSHDGVWSRRRVDPTPGSTSWSLIPTTSTSSRLSPVKTSVGGPPRLTRVVSLHRARPLVGE